MPRSEGSDGTEASAASVRHAASSRSDDAVENALRHDLSSYVSHAPAVATAGAAIATGWGSARGAARGAARGCCWCSGGSGGEGGDDDDNDDVGGAVLFCLRG